MLEPRIEHLSHFRCAHCGQSWIISQAPQREQWYCPWCGEAQCRPPAAGPEPSGAALPEVTQEELRLETVRWRDAADLLGDIRYQVFVLEQRVPLEVELDAFDEEACHVLAWVGEHTVATGRLLPDGHIGRVAVRKPWRGLTIGAQVMRHLEAEARARGLARVELSAQLQAKGFYERLGYALRGDVFEEAGIPHQTMYKRLIE